MDQDDRVLADRRKALEEDFFRKQNEKLKAKLKAEREREQARAELRQAFPNAPDDALDRLIDHGLDVDAAAALAIVPCVMVAWAEGDVSDREREAVLAAAGEHGLSPGGRAYEFLSRWLADAPSPALMELWSHYVAALCKGLTAEERARLRDRVVGGARDVARATGGFLGLGSKISDAEAAVLAKVEAAFDT